MSEHFQSRQLYEQTRLKSIRFVWLRILASEPPQLIRGERHGTDVCDVLWRVNVRFRKAQLLLELLKGSLSLFSKARLYVVQCIFAFMSSFFFAECVDFYRRQLKL